MHATVTPAAPATRRLLAGAAALVLAAAVVALVGHGTGWWQFFALGAAPALARLLGAGTGLAHGQLHPRAVPAYNLMHRVCGPVLLAAAVAAGVLGTAWLVGALAWGLHIAIDRAVGYGLRTPDGFQRS
jgi:Domain of unknown function (DUF4260)